MSKRQPVIWDADPHTIAKITILKGYLNAWFRILGQRRRGETILYVDGFAGPGYYRNHDEGSPLAAVRAAHGSIKELGERFVAQQISCIFIEGRRDRFDALKLVLAPFVGKPKLEIHPYNTTFAEGIVKAQAEHAELFNRKHPLFVFADPFGGKGIPFGTFVDCMKGEASELLINLDADGIGRMFAAENNNHRDQQLTELFGDDSWKTALTVGSDLKTLSVQILDLYKRRLMAIGVRFVWPFAMRGVKDLLNYYLVFATKHPLGMEKMKESMRTIDKDRTYTFSDAHSRQGVLFRNDQPEEYADAMFRYFNGKAVTPDEALAYALSETPFSNAKGMLAVLEKIGRLRVEIVEGENRKAGSFPEGKVRALHFGRFEVRSVQGELEID